MASEPDSASGPETGEFWREKSIEELAAEQGVRPVERIEDILGRGADLWDSDEDFEQFLKGIYERRRQDRNR